MFNSKVTRQWVAAILSFGIVGSAYARSFSRTRCSDNEGHLTREQAEKVSFWALRCNKITDPVAARPLRYALERKHQKEELPFPTWFNAEGKAWLGPKDPETYAKIATPGNCEVQIPKEYDELQICLSGCYTAGQRILSNTGKMGGAQRQEWTPISLLKQQTEVSVASVNGSSTLDRLELLPVPVTYFVADKKPVLQRIYSIQTLGGAQLEVTSEHPLLLSSGSLVPAKELNVGDQLVSVTGEPEIVTHISSELRHTQVYNLETTAAIGKTKLIAVEGVLSATHYYQSEALNKINRLISAAQAAQWVQP